jgi:hypothetical protein
LRCPPSTVMQVSVEAGFDPGSRHPNAISLLRGSTAH